MVRTEVPNEHISCKAILHALPFGQVSFGVIKVLHNADGGGRVKISGKKALRRCKVQR